MDNRDIYEYGWGLKGQRIYGQRPGKKRERISIMSGYHLGKLVAPFTWIGSCNLQVLIAWLTEMLLPTIGAGKKIVLDNASFHRCKLVRKVVEAARCELIQSFQRFWGMGELSIHRWKGFELYPVINKKTVYLPKYSPALNPIEHPWHRIKQRVRKPMTSTTQHLHDLIDSVICFICQPLPA
jgi:transposase